VPKRGTPLKSGYLSAVGLSGVKMVADNYGIDILLNITSTGDELLRIVNIDDLN